MGSRRQHQRQYGEASSLLSGNVKDYDSAALDQAAALTGAVCVTGREKEMKHGNRYGIIMETVECLAEDFLTGDRDADSELPRGSIERAILGNEVTISEIVNRFALKLGELIPVPVDEPGVHSGQIGHQVRSLRMHKEVAQLAE